MTEPLIELLLFQQRDKLFSKKVYGVPFSYILKPLLESINPETGGVSQIIGKNEDYIVETASTCLLTLSKIGILSEQYKQKMQAFIVNNALHTSNDLSGWGYTGTMSNWSTLICIWGLVGSGYQENSSLIEKSLKWLLHQQSNEGGWGIFPGNESNVFITANCLYVIKLAARTFNPLKPEVQQSLTKGVEYLLSREINNTGGWGVALNDINPEPCSTGMAIWAIHHCMDDNNLPKKELLSRGIDCLTQMQQGITGTWPSNIVAQATYNNGSQDKTIYGYSPSIALALLTIGQSPHDETIKRTIQYLLKRRQKDGWPIEGTTPEQKPVGYSNRSFKTIDSFSFTTALAIWTIEAWQKALFQDEISKIVNYWNTTNSQNNPGHKMKSKIFVVHGHDDLSKLEMARYLEKLGCEAIVLHEQVNAGQTIIEKIETYSDVEFGIVLYTPDDKGSSIKDENNNKKRARQNVIFEHGYLISKLGRKNVLALVKDDIELPGDINGVVYIKMDNSESWKLSVAKEMKMAGINIDFNKVI